MTMMARVRRLAGFAGGFPGGSAGLNLCPKDSVRRHRWRCRLSTTIAFKLPYQRLWPGAWYEILQAPPIAAAGQVPQKAPVANLAAGGNQAAFLLVPDGNGGAASCRELLRASRGRPSGRSMTRPASRRRSAAMLLEEPSVHRQVGA